ncbi:MAG TPA: APC family permease [Terriglobia bacterium]|nr:APC family permease [Terriglobia bacterium]
MQSGELIRGIGLPAAVSLNMIDMIGVGPFITIPLIVAAMGGPQAMLGWIFGAVLSICDGLVWAELGAALPTSGGSYRYLKASYDPVRLGKLVAFLFIWQLTFSAPLSIASGCIGLAQYAGFLFPSLTTTYWQADLHWLNASINVTPATFVAMGTCLLAVFLLYRNVTIIGRISEYLWVGVMLTIAWVIVSGVTHFNSARAFDFPQGAFVLSPDFFTGLGAAMLIAVYDYWGYYNICFIGGEIRDPGRTIPRAILYSIFLVGIIYIVMNISILGVIPWRELGETANSDARRYIISVFMQRLYGNWAASLATILIMWTAFASVFSLLLGYSRVPYAAAVDGDYFRSFSRVHPEHRFPNVSLLVLGTLAAVFCLFRLQDVIAAMVVIRLMIQFLAQTVGVMVLRVKRPDLDRPFKMWFYPLPAIVALVGFLYVLVMRKDFTKELRYGAIILILGVIFFFLRNWKWKGNSGTGNSASDA